MVEEVMGYKTKGGRLFASREMAEEYERGENRDAFVKEFMCLTGLSYTSNRERFGDYWCAEVFDHAEKAVELLKKHGALK